VKRVKKKKRSSFITFNSRGTLRHDAREPCGARSVEIERE